MKKYQQFVHQISQQDYSAPAERFEKVGLLANASFSMAGEVGELIDAVKRHILYGKELDIANLKEELGDVLFYVAMACNAMGWNLEEIAQANKEKLARRFPNGVFSEKDAIERKDKQQTSK